MGGKGYTNRIMREQNEASKRSKQMARETWAAEYQAAMKAQKLDLPNADFIQHLYERGFSISEAVSASK